MVIDTVGEGVYALREAKLVIFPSVAQGTMASVTGIEPCVHNISRLVEASGLRVHCAGDVNRFVGFAIVKRGFNSAARIHPRHDNTAMVVYAAGRSSSGTGHVQSRVRRAFK